MAKIQNEGLGEHAIRDLNDGINKLIREKYHWNQRIKELGGGKIIIERRGGLWRWRSRRMVGRVMAVRMYKG